jgi:hypothetical protein
VIDRSRTEKWDGFKVLFKASTIMVGIDAGAVCQVLRKDESWVLPAIPYSGTGEPTPLLLLQNSTAVWISPSGTTRKCVCGIKHLRDFSASRKAGLALAVSDRALIIRAAVDESFAQQICWDASSSSHQPRAASVERVAICAMLFR